jgi:hypothetical protein
MRMVSATLAYAFLAAVFMTGSTLPGITQQDQTQTRRLYSVLGKPTLPVAQNTFGGLGIELTMEGGLLKVITPSHDSPPSRA